MTGAAHDGPRGLHRRRRIRWVAAIVVLIAIVGVATTVLLTRVDDRKAEAAVGPAPARTASVVKMDLADQRTLDGKLGYGVERQLTGHRAGTITGLPASGTVLDRGRTVYEVDAKRIPLFLSDLPLYRDVGQGMTDGPDVQAIEENLRGSGCSPVSTRRCGLPGSRRRPRSPGGSLRGTRRRCARRVPRGGDQTGGCEMWQIRLPAELMPVQGAIGT